MTKSKGKLVSVVSKKGKFLQHLQNTFVEDIAEIKVLRDLEERALKKAREWHETKRTYKFMIHKARYKIARKQLGLSKKVSL